MIIVKHLTPIMRWAAVFARTRIASTVTCCIIFFSAFPVGAQEEEDVLKTVEKAANSGITLGTALQVLAGIMTVIIAIGSIAYFVRKLRDFQASINSPEEEAMFEHQVMSELGLANTGTGMHTAAPNTTTRPLAVGGVSPTGSQPISGIQQALQTPQPPTAPQPAVANPSAPFTAAGAPAIAATAPQSAPVTRAEESPEETAAPRAVEPSAPGDVTTLERLNTDQEMVRLEGVDRAKHRLRQLRGDIHQEGPASLVEEVRGEIVSWNAGRAKCLIVQEQPSSMMLPELLKRYPMICVAAPGAEPYIIQRVQDAVLGDIKL